MKRNALANSSTLILLLVLGGCASGYLNKTRSARDDFFLGRFSEAAAQLEKQAHTESNEQVLYLLERATALHHASEFEESSKDFLQADKLSEISDYTSLSGEASTLLISDEIKHYRVEEYEYVQISQYLALNFLMQKKYEDALVECRRVNHKLYRFKSEAKRNYVQSAMARYVSAMIYESRGEYDDAYIDYTEAYKLAPNYGGLKEDIVRMAIRSRRSEDADRWSRQFEFDGAKIKSIRTSMNDAEIVVVVENGRAPEKHPHPQFPAIPEFVPRFSPFSGVNVTVEGVADKLPSQTLYNVEQAALQNFNDKYSGILAKKIAGIVAKKVVADQVSNHTDPLVGFLLFWGMHASDTADTRAWLTLPKEFQVVRVRVKEPGSYKVKFEPIRGDNSYGGALAMTEKTVEVKAKEKSFISLRTF